MNTRADLAFPGGHPDSESRDPDEVTLKISQRDPSTALGMTVIVGEG